VVADMAQIQLILLLAVMVHQAKEMLAEMGSQQRDMVQLEAAVAVQLV
jgi:hypothetical protein